MKKMNQVLSLLSIGFISLSAQVASAQTATYTISPGQSVSLNGPGMVSCLGGPVVPQILQCDCEWYDPWVGGKSQTLQGASIDDAERACKQVASPNPSYHVENCKSVSGT